ncbi:MAG: C-GCAxxG-C-C family protein [Chloroflexota bacterium]|nr:C-GCAxxG-C-C family protein [Chloroflexota bacterium]
MGQSKEEKAIIEKAYKLGYEYERTYRGCGQCAIAALQDVFDMRDDNTFKALTGYAGGGGITGDAGCGAYVGGILFLSMLKGRERDNFSDPEGIRFDSFALARKLHDKFVAEYGTVICREMHVKLLGRPYYLPDPDEYAKFDNAGAHDTVCPGVVGNTARWVAEIILEEKLLPEDKLKKLAK